MREVRGEGPDWSKLNRKVTVTQITTHYNTDMQKSISEHTMRQTSKWIGYSSRRLKCNKYLIKWSVSTTAQRRASLLRQQGRDMAGGHMAAVTCAGLAAGVALSAGVALLVEPLGAALHTQPGPPQLQ